MAYMVLLDRACDECKQPAKFKVFDITNAFVGKYCLQHATNRVAELKKEEMETRKAFA